LKEFTWHGVDILLAQYNIISLNINGTFVDSTICDGVNSNKVAEAVYKHEIT